jgi:hypothetical protein
LAEAICAAATITTPLRKNQEVTYPLKVQNKIAERQKARRIWQQTHNPSDKDTFNRINNQLNKLIKEIKNKSFSAYLENLSPHADKEYSLWKATNKIKQTITRMPPILNGDDYAHSDEEKAKLFAKHLGSVFQPLGTQSNLEPVITYRDYQTIRRITPMEIATEIDCNINPKKAAGYDKITPAILKELTKKSNNFTYLHL